MDRELGIYIYGGGSNGIRMTNIIYYRSDKEYMTDPIYDRIMKDNIVDYVEEFKIRKTKNAKVQDNKMDNSNLNNNTESK